MNQTITKPVVSIIVPVFKVEEYLNRCIKSVLNQTYKDIEVILVDDGSPDRCPQMCDDYSRQDNRIRVIHKKNGGLSSARNAGIEIASGEYIAFVDSDDWIVNDMIEYAIDLIHKEKADIVSTSYILTDKEDPIVEEKNNYIVMNREEALEYFLDIGMKSRISDYPTGIKLFKKELFSGIRFPEGVLYEDYTTNVKLIKKCAKYIKSNKVCYFYFQGGKSIVRSEYKLRDSQLLDQCSNVCELVKNENKVIRRIAKEKLARSYLSLMIKIIVYGFSDDIQADEGRTIAKNYVKKTRENFKLLIKSKMPISRKLLLIAVCIDYRPLCILRKVVK